MVVIVPIGVTMTTAAVEQPSHSLLWMFMYKENRVQSNAYDATNFLQALGSAAR